MTKELKADLSLIGITAFWGASFPMTSLALKNIPPFSFIAIRYILSALILAVIFFKSFRNLNKRTLKSAFFIGGSLFVGTAFQVAGLVYTAPSKSGFITGLYVVFVPIIIAMLYKRLPDLKTIIGIILSLIGLGIMSLSGDMTINKGDVLTFLGAAVFATQILLVDRYTQEVDIVLLTCLELLVVGLGSAIPAAAIEGFRFTITTTMVVAILFTAIFSTAIALTVQNKVQPFTDPTHAAIIYLAEPVFGAIFSLFIGDKLGGKTLLGCLIILIGMLAINVKAEQKENIIEERL